jgi:hypothetical protein
MQKIKLKETDPFLYKLLLFIFYPNPTPEISEMLLPMLAHHACRLSFQNI